MLEDKEKIRERENHRLFKQVLNAFIDRTEMSTQTKEQTDEDIRIVPKIFYNDFLKQLKVEFKIGNKQLYKIKNLPEFYEKMLNKELYQYGAKLNFIHKKEVFENDSQKLLEFLLKYAEIIKYNNEELKTYTYYRKNFALDNIPLSNSGLDELFEVLNNTEVDFQKNSLETNVYFTDKEPEIKFEIEELENKQYKVKCNIDVFKFDILQGKNHLYMLLSNTLYRLSENFKQNTLKLLETLRKNYTSEMILDEKELTYFFAMIVPKIEDKVQTHNLSKQTKEKCIPEKLAVKMYLDYDKYNNIIADVKFCYGDNEFNPFDEPKNDYVRNIIGENEILTDFLNTGFKLDKANLRLILDDNNKIYDFLSEQIETYMKKYEVLATETFRKKEIGQLKINEIGVKIQNNLLQIDLSKIGIDLTELPEIISKYKLKKKYYRLKDGSFIELKDNSNLNFLSDLSEDISQGCAQLKDGIIYLQNYRSLYLEKCLKTLKNVEIKKNEQYQKMVDKLEQKTNTIDISLPKNLKCDLRIYQKIGYRWLKTLEEYELGGILADDMGLGKTLQVIAVMLDYANKERENAKTSIVVCPSSLTLNWLAEIKKFAPTLKAGVVNGSSQERTKKIENMQDFNVIITSYDSLKRDIDTYEKINYYFKYMIIDEAQYIKNNNTQNAKVIKKIKSDIKYALTGTPIENSLSELWSIFDYIMPGYLFNYKKFKESFETPIVKENNQNSMEKLKRMIEPFVLRRMKREVLTELPDKTVSVLYNEMQDEQQKLYLSYLANARKEVAEEIEINGFQNSQIKILALLMRLRQICCHPNLFLQNYEGDSSKLNQCIDLVTYTVQSGHKILLFSGYTSMFEMIEKQLKAKKISYFKLTGQTKVDERIKLVDEFNENEDIKVFLISLKAGGTGLNLIGADVVIHYDPWWNLSAENQATDRTYRIGQKNNVQVYKLITKNSIEEKIYELQQKKAKLADNMLNTQNTFISKLSKDDILKLFG